MSSFAFLKLSNSGFMTASDKQQPSMVNTNCLGFGESKGEGRIAMCHRHVYFVSRLGGHCSERMSLSWVYQESKHALLRWNLWHNFLAIYTTIQREKPFH